MDGRKTAALLGRYATPGSNAPSTTAEGVAAWWASWEPAPESEAIIVVGAVRRRRDGDDHLQVVRRDLKTDLRRRWSRGLSAASLAAPASYIDLLARSRTPADNAEACCVPETRKIKCAPSTSSSVGRLPRKRWTRCRMIAPYGVAARAIIHNACGFQAQPPIFVAGGWCHRCCGLMTGFLWEISAPRSGYGRASPAATVGQNMSAARGGAVWAPSDGCQWTKTKGLPNIVLAAILRKRKP